MSDNIPFDIQMAIMNKLPVKSLLQFRSVSKLWKNFIDSFNFVREYGFRKKNNCPFYLTYKQNFAGFLFSLDDNLALSNIVSNLNVPQLTPIATCEGLWCFSYWENSMLLIWNPSLRRSTNIAVLNYYSDNVSPKMLFGFGLHPVTLDPTILKINYSNYGHDSWYVSIYKLSRERWSIVDSNCLPNQSIRITRSGQAVVDGKIFWVGSEKFFNEDGTTYKRYMLVSFDIITQQFAEIELPEEIISAQYLPPYYISQHEDHIILSGSFRFVEFSIIYAWELHIADGEVVWYRQMFTLPFPIQNKLKLIGLTTYDQPIVEASFVRQSEQALQVFNPNYEHFQNLVIGANNGSIFIGPYKESLVLLND